MQSVSILDKLLAAEDYLAGCTDDYFCYAFHVLLDQERQEVIPMLHIELVPVIPDKATVIQHYFMEKISAFKLSAAH
uniref:Group-specific protein n=1 Tax=Syphacia muris TaxID=451379 RepID=A0A0N5AJ80_9BILA